MDVLTYSEVCDYVKIGGAVYHFMFDKFHILQVTAKFKCVVRVVAAFPWQAQDFYSCGTYRIRLTLEDPTARIHAYLYAEDGV